MRKYRINAELTLRDFGKSMGLSAATLLRIEQGKACDSKTLTRLLAFLLEEV